MPTLHGEHPVVDIIVRQAAFDGFADARTQAGVRAEHVRQPVDDPRYVVDLELDTAADAETCGELLHSVVWTPPRRSGHRRHADSSSARGDRVPDLCLRVPGETG